MYASTEVTLPLDGSQVSLTPDPASEHVWIRVLGASDACLIGASGATTFMIEGRNGLVYLGLGVGELFARSAARPVGSSAVRVAVLRRTAE